MSGIDPVLEAAQARRDARVSGVPIGVSAAFMASARSRGWTAEQCAVATGLSSDAFIAVGMPSEAFIRPLSITPVEKDIRARQALRHISDLADPVAPVVAKTMTRPQCAKWIKQGLGIDDMAVKANVSRDRIKAFLIRSKLWPNEWLVRRC